MTIETTHDLRRADGLQAWENLRSKYVKYIELRGWLLFNIYLFAHVIYFKYV